MALRHGEGAGSWEAVLELRSEKYESVLLIPILADPAKRLGDRIFADLSGAIVAEEHRLFDIAGERVPDASVSTETCAPVDAGSDALCSVWQDPTFDVATPAVYYARVVEVPSCRWSTRLCNRTPPRGRPGFCEDPMESLRKVDYPRGVQPGTLPRTRIFAHRKENRCLPPIS